MLKLYSTLTEKKEEFVPIDAGNVRMYVCGPTVYDKMHIGNTRSIVIYDILYRILLELFPKVTYVRNITDIDDKIFAAAKSQGVSIGEITRRNTEYFHNSMDRLGVLRPNFEPKATENIREMIDIIQKLLDNGFAYISNDHVLFEVDKMLDYGKFAGRVKEEMIAGARIEISEFKKNPMDFVLWKPEDENDDQSGIFDSPFGRGKPGWHIECSAMSSKYLGVDFDIHGGGADLRFPHHQNEIAQNLCAFPGSHYAKYWVHNGFLTVNGKKMGKSLGNFVVIDDVLAKNHPEAIRYALLSTHYRKPLDFNEKLMYDSEKSVKKLHEAIAEFDVSEFRSVKDLPFFEYLLNDINSVGTFSYLHQLAKNSTKDGAIELKSAMQFLGIFNSKFLEKTTPKIDESYILKQIELRKQAKTAKNWRESDRIRDELRSHGVVITDIANGEMEWEFV